MDERAMLVVNTNKVLSENSRNSFKDACRRWQCDYIEVTESTAPYHHAALKLKAFDITTHKRVFIVDSDTLIRSDAPNIFEITDPMKFYAVQNEQAHHPAVYKHANRNIAQQEVLKILSNKVIQHKVDPDYIGHNFFNSGIVLATRKYHEEILALGFYLFVQCQGLQWWDQIPLNVAAFSILGGYDDLGDMWNHQFPNNFHRMTSYIYHFAGDPKRYEILKTLPWLHVADEVDHREKLHTLISKLELKVGVELGTQKGEYAQYLLRDTYLFMHLVDSWKHREGYHDIANVSDAEHEKNYNQTRNTMANFPGRHQIYRGLSEHVVREFVDSSLDFIYIDADHSYKATMTDLEAWYPKVRQGGLIAGHDFLDGENICGSNFGVRSAVFDFLRDKTHALHVTAEQWPSWYFVKE